MSDVYPPSAEIEIAAPLQAVWDILLDNQGYGAWNRFIPEAVGDLKTLNTPIRMRVKLGERKVGAVMVSVTVTPPSDGQALWVHEHASWLAKTGLIRSRRHHELTAVSDIVTRYRTWEPFRGPLKPFMPFAKIDAGFKLQAVDLKAECNRRDAIKSR